MTTIATLKRLSAKSLSEKIIEEVNATDPTFAVIDVRDNGKLTFARGQIISTLFFGYVFIMVFLTNPRLHWWPHQGLNKYPCAHSGGYDADSSAPPERQKDCCFPLCP